MRILLAIIINIIAIVVIFQCSDFIDVYDVYEIEQGEHYSHRVSMPRHLLSLRDGRVMRFGVYFTESCLYTPQNDDINKLYGFTDSNSFLHEHSARFGWRHNGKGSIELFAYWYADGKRGFYKMGETVPYRHDQYLISAKDGQYTFQFNDVAFSTPRFKKGEKGIRARLFPYFGGDATAPNTMMISICEYN